MIKEKTFTVKIKSSLTLASGQKLVLMNFLER